MFFNIVSSLNKHTTAAACKSDGGKIYKLKTDGTYRTKVSDDRAHSLNIIGDLIYYSFDKLYRMKTDGTNNMQITDDIVSNYNISNGWIYYHNKKYL